MSSEQQTEEVGNVPNVESAKLKAPCLDTIFKRLKECNGSIMALFYDLEFITRTEPVKDSEAEEGPKVSSTPNLTDLQIEVDVLRNHIRDCRKKLDKARWG